MNVKSSKHLIRKPVGEIHDRVSAAARALGASKEAALSLAAHLTRAEQSGHPSHGLLMLPRYLNQIETGVFVPSAEPKIVKRSGSTAVLDGAWGFGQHAASVATNIALRLAETSGTSTVTIRRSAHVGRLGEYLERVAEAGKICIMQVGAVGSGIGQMAPFGAQSNIPFLSTNPWAVGIPANPGPVIFDAATTAIAEGKVHAARDRGMLLPEGAIVDKDGALTGDPSRYYDGGTLAPLGGALAGHKGYGLSVAAALLGGLAYADDVTVEVRGLAPMLHDDGAEGTLGGVTITVIDPESFGSRSKYKEHVTAVGNELRKTGAMMPGDFERMNREKNADAISIPIETLAGLQEVEKYAGLATTEARDASALSSIQ